MYEVASVQLAVDAVDDDTVLATVTYRLGFDAGDGRPYRVDVDLLGKDSPADWSPSAGPDSPLFAFEPAVVPPDATTVERTVTATIPRLLLNEDPEAAGRTTEFPVHDADEVYARVRLRPLRLRVAPLPSPSLVTKGGLATLQQLPVATFVATGTSPVVTFHGAGPLYRDR